MTFSVDCDILNGHLWHIASIVTYNVVVTFSGCTTGCPKCPLIKKHPPTCTTAKRHNDAICHNRRYMSQMAIQNVTIDAKCHNLTLNVTTLNVTTISLFSSKCHNIELTSNRQAMDHTLTLGLVGCVVGYVIANIEWVSGNFIFFYFLYSQNQERGGWGRGGGSTKNFFLSGSGLGVK